MFPILRFRWPRRPEAPPVPLAEHVAAMNNLREVLDEALHAYRAAIRDIAEHAWGPADLLEAHRRHLALLAGMIGPQPSRSHLIEVRERLAEELRAFHARLPRPGRARTPRGERLPVSPPPPDLRAALDRRARRALAGSLAWLELLPLAAIRERCGDDACEDLRRALERRLRVELDPADFWCRWDGGFALVLDAAAPEAARVAERCAQALTGVYPLGDSQVTIACAAWIADAARGEPYFFSPIQTGLDHAVSPSISVSRT